MRLEIDHTNHLLHQYYSRQLKRLRKEINDLQMKLHEKNEYIETQANTIFALLNDVSKCKKFSKEQQDIIKNTHFY